jgi:hypothetical protein
MLWRGFESLDSLPDLLHAVTLPVGKNPCVVVGDLPTGTGGEIVQQIRQPQLLAHILHGTVLDVLAILGGFFLAVQRYDDGMGVAPAAG